MIDNYQRSAILRDLVMLVQNNEGLQEHFMWMLKDKIFGFGSRRDSIEKLRYFHLFIADHTSLQIEHTKYIEAFYDELLEK